MIPESDKISKIDFKQVNLDMKENRIIYLYKMIIIVKERLRKMENYIITVGESIIEEFENKAIPYYVGMLYLDAMEHHHCYLLNLLGDCEKTSISYFKYRKICKKKKFPCCEFDKETEEYLSELNKARNFCNHIPESILIEDLQFIRNSDIVQTNKELFYKNLIVPQHETIEYECFKEKHERYLLFYYEIKELLSYIIMDYELTIGNTVTIMENQKNI